MERRIHWLGVCVLVGIFILGPGDRAKAQTGGISFWTTEIEPKRMAIQKDLAERFRGITGTPVEIIPVEESELPTRVMAAAAARALPDMIFVPLDYLIIWAEEGVLDDKAATEVISNLGPETFAQGPLRLAGVSGGGWAAIPADGWGQLLLFRKDLFGARTTDQWLGTPDTWEKIVAAARALHAPPKIWGIGVGTDPTQIYTQQVFEQFALSNSARLVNSCTGDVDLETPEFIQTLAFYKMLAGYSPPGNIYWRQTREDYFGGRQAMTLWSPYILDEMAGLRDSVPITISDLKKPLHQVTGIVTSIRGPMGAKPVQWGQVSYFGITTGARPDVRKWAEFLVGDGYLDWLSMAPEGKFPLRPRFEEGWKQLKIGVDRRARIADLYPDEVVKGIIAGVEDFDRWGFTAGKGACVGQIYGTKVVIRILRRYLDGELSAEATAREMTAAIRDLSK